MKYVSNKKYNRFMKFIIFLMIWTLVFTTMAPIIMSLAMEPEAMEELEETEEDAQEEIPEETSEETEQEIEEKAGDDEAEDEELHAAKGAAEGVKLMDIAAAEIGAVAHTPVNIKEYLKDTPYNSLIRDSFIDDDGVSYKTGITYFDKNNQMIEDISDGVPVTAQMLFVFCFGVPQELNGKIQEGDYYIIELDESLKASFSPFDLVGSDGEVYGEVRYDGSSNAIIIEFTSAVAEHVEIEGYFQFRAVFDQNTVGEPKDITIIKSEDEEVVGGTVFVKPDLDSSISKSGYTDKAYNPEYITWEILFNKDLSKLSGAELQELIPEGLIFESYELYEVQVDIYGNLKEDSESLVTSWETKTEADGSVIFYPTDNGKLNGAYKLIIKTKISETYREEEKEQVKFRNKAVLHFDGEDEEELLNAGAEVTTYFGSALTKEIKDGYDSNTRTVTWGIKYNYNELALGTDAYLIDSIKLKGSSEVAERTDVKIQNLEIYPVTFDQKSGKAIIGTEALEEEKDYVVEYDPNKAKFKVTFPNGLSQAVYVTYDTVIQKDLSENVTIANHVEDGDEHDYQAGGTIRPQNIVKSVDDIDYNDKYITWKLQINMSRNLMKDAVITDTFAEGLFYQESSLIIKNPDTGKVLQEKKDYVFDYDDQEHRIEIKFIGDYKQFKNRLTIEYKTDFDFNVIYDNEIKDNGTTGSGETIKGVFYENHAVLKWTDEGDAEQEDKADTDKNLTDEQMNNGWKNGDYNAVNKRITWELGTNYNGYEEGITVTDEIQEPQIFVKGSVEIYTYTLDNKGKPVIGTKVESPEDKGIEIEEPEAESGGMLTIRIPATTERYIITFDTTLDGILIDQTNFENEAVYSLAGKHPKSFAVYSEVGVKDGDTHLRKTGMQNGEGYVEWTVDINPNQSTLNDVVVTDVLSCNQLIDENSITLKKVVQDSSGSFISYSEPLTKDTDYYVVIEFKECDCGVAEAHKQQKITFSFAEEIREAYQLTYKTLVMIDEDETNPSASNHASVSHDGKAEILDDSSQTVELDDNDAKGSIRGKRYSFSIQKVDGDNKGKFLSGATIYLYSKSESGLILKDTAVTDENGIAHFNTMLRKNEDYTFILKETEAPIGYTVTEILKDGLELTGNASDLSEDVPAAEVENMPTKVYLEKIDGENQELIKEPAEFKIQKYDAQGEQWNWISWNGDAWLWETSEEEELATPIYTENGKLEVSYLPEGTYRMMEITAPEGYIINQTWLVFELVKNEHGEIYAMYNDEEITADNALTYSNFKGSAGLYKTDVEGNELTGAVFALFTEDGEEIETKETDENGYIQFNNLAPGNYVIREITAPDSYVRNKEEITFQIDEKYEGIPEIVVLGEFINYTGRINLIKHDEDGEVLKGAKFRLWKYNIDNEEEKEQIGEEQYTDENGWLQYDELAPGSYYLEEVEAVPGYIRNTEIESLKFNIEESAEGEPELILAEGYINYQGKVTLHKTDEEEQPLAGVEFQLWIDEENEQLVEESLLTDENGNILLKGLKPGKYKIRETKALEGYEQLKEDILFEIVSEAEGEPEVIAISVKNIKVEITTEEPCEEPEPEEEEPCEKDNEKPVWKDAVEEKDELKQIKTGDNSAIWIYVLGAVAGFVLLVVIKCKKRKKEDL